MDSQRPLKKTEENQKDLTVLDRQHLLQEKLVVPRATEDPVAFSQALPLLEDGPRLIFIGESHEDTAAYRFLTYALPKLQQKQYKIFLESPANSTQYPDVQIMYHHCLFSLNILNTFPSGIPQSLKDFDSKQKEFFKTLREDGIGEKDELLSLRREYETLRNRRQWLEHRKTFLEKLIESGLAVIAIDVENPEAYQGQNLQKRRDFMAKMIMDHLKDNENGIVVCGVSHLLNTEELGFPQSGFEVLFSREKKHGLKFHFLYSDDKGPIYQEAVMRITTHQKNFPSIIASLFVPLNDNNSGLAKLVDNILDLSKVKMQTLLRHTHLFFNGTPPKKWKAFPEDKLKVSKYKDHQALFFTMETKEAAEAARAKEFSESLKNSGFDVDLKSMDGGSRLSIIVDLNR